MSHDQNLYRFEIGLGRAAKLCQLYAYSLTQYPAALDLTDVLRAAVMLAVGALDLLVHDTYRTEVFYRLEQRVAINGLKVPFNVLISDDIGRYAAMEADLKASHSYRSFVAPDKIAEVICHFVSQSWSSISLQIEEPEQQVKRRLAEIVKWRNRIAHESDVNPQLGGVDLWAIQIDDVEESIAFLRQLGAAIVAVVRDR